MELVYFEGKRGQRYGGKHAATVLGGRKPYGHHSKRGTAAQRLRFFVGWSEDKSSTTAGYIPAPRSRLGESNIQLFAIWTQDQPYDDFRTITYVAGGDNVVLADNPQIYRWNQEGRFVNQPLAQGSYFYRLDLRADRP